MFRFGRVGVVAALLLAGCKGSALVDVNMGYQNAPFGDLTQHAGTVAVNVGIGEDPELGYGFSARARLMPPGEATDVGLHGYWIAEDDGPVGFYLRGIGLIGLGQFEGKTSVTFSPVINPGVFVYFGDDLPSFLSLSATIEYTLSPANPYAQPWFGIQIGMGVGGSRY